MVMNVLIFFFNSTDLDLSSFPLVSLKERVQL